MRRRLFIATLLSPFVAKPKLAAPPARAALDLGAFNAYTAKIAEECFRHSCKNLFNVDTSLYYRISREAAHADL